MGEKFGASDSRKTFNLPDFRDRIPLGVDRFEGRVTFATQPGSLGG